MNETEHIQLDGWEKVNNNNIKQNNTYNNTKKDDIYYIFVLAGGLKHNGEVHDFVKWRLHKAYELYILNNDRSCKIIVMGGGTYHKPPILNENNYVIHESTSCALYLNNMGIPPEDIYREWSSYDTIANGYYAFINYIGPLKINECDIITSSFHMPRVKTIFHYFNCIFMNNNLVMNFIETENNNIDNGVLHERMKREYKSRLNFEKNITNKIHSVSMFSKWFYEKHGAYKSLISYVENSKINKSY